MFLEFRNTVHGKCCLSGQFDSFKREQKRIKKIQEILRVIVMFLIFYVSYKTKIILRLTEKDEETAFYAGHIEALKHFY